MTRKEALIKSLIWRFTIAIPISFFITYWYIGQYLKSIELVIILNIISTILYFIFDLFWFKNIRKYFNK
jgi:uncharacterized membrane protein